MKRTNSFDYIRAYSIVGILICHFLFNWESTTGTGRWLASTFNVIFLMLSAILFGLKWDETGNKPLPISFITKRIMRLTCTYYPFLAIMFCFLFFIDRYSLGIKDIIMHLTFLPWFDKLPGFGHLWFLTMIVICYVGILIYSRFRKYLHYLLLPLLFVSAGLHYVFLSLGLPGQMLSYLIVFVIIFEHCDKFCCYAKKASLYLSVPTTITATIGIAALFYQGIYENNRFVAEWLGIIDAVLIMFCTLALFNKIKTEKCDRVTTFLSNISFEIYLVHHVFAFGTYSIINICPPHPIVAFAALVTLSITLATILHWFSTKITKILC